MIFHLTSLTCSNRITVFHWRCDLFDPFVNQKFDVWCSTDLSFKILTKDVNEATAELKIEVDAGGVGRISG